MRQTGRYGTGDSVTGVAAEINRARRRLDIIEAAEKRLIGARGAGLPARTGDAKEPNASKPKRPRGSYRLRGFYGR
jgi:hypothetical protein